MVCTQANLILKCIGQILKTLLSLYSSKTVIEFSGLTLKSLLWARFCQLFTQVGGYMSQTHNFSAQVQRSSETACSLLHRYRPMATPYTSPQTYTTLHFGVQQQTHFLCLSGEAECLAILPLRTVKVSPDICDVLDLKAQPTQSCYLGPDNTTEFNRTFPLNIVGVSLSKTTKLRISEDSRILQTWRFEALTKLLSLVIDESELTEW